MTSSAWQLEQAKQRKVLPVEALRYLRAFAQFERRWKRTPHEAELAVFVGRSRSAARQALLDLVRRGVMSKDESLRVRPYTINSMGKLALRRAARQESKAPAVDSESLSGQTQSEVAA